MKYTTTVVFSNICATGSSQHPESSKVNAVKARQMVASILQESIENKKPGCRSLSGKGYFVNESSVGKTLHPDLEVRRVFDKGTCIL